MRTNIKSIFMAVSLLFAASVIAFAGQDKKKDEKEAVHKAIVAAIQNQSFDVVITQNIPKTSGEPVTQYSSGEYNIKVRGNKAVVFIPGVDKGGDASFGGGDTHANPCEIVECTCEKTSQKKVTHNYTLKTIEGKSSYEITLRVNENGTAKVIVDRMPMTHFMFYAEVNIP